MIKPFNLRHLPLVHRLREQGISFHTESALTNSLNPLKGALVNMFVDGDFPTYVWRGEESGAAGFIQLYLEENKHHAHILYLSSTNKAEVDSEDAKVNGYHVNESVWLPLLDQAMVEAGGRGIHSLVAEVSEIGAELPIFRRAGFAVYTRQDIWVYDKVIDFKQKPHLNLLSPRQSADDWDVQLLYAYIVPRLVQLVEPVSTLGEEDTWVLREKDEITAVVHIHSGPTATWLRLFIHPNAETRTEEIVWSALEVNPPRPDHPVYCCVRRYQSWLQTVLADSGFTAWGSQAVMVKHTVQQAKMPLRDLSTMLEKQGIPASSPMIQRYRPANGDDKTKS